MRGFVKFPCASCNGSGWVVKKSTPKITGYDEELMCNIASFECIYGGCKRCSGKGYIRLEVVIFDEEK